MAQLKDSLITGDLRVTGTIYGNVPLNDLTNADDLKAIEGLTGTSGILTKTAANTWALNSTATPASHTHGNIQNGGTLQTNDITIASGDKIIVTDSSDSNKIARTSISFDGSTATKALTQKGTWETFNNYSHPTGDGNLHVPATGTSNNGKVLKAGSTAGSISWGTLSKSDVGLGNVANTTITVTSSSVSDGTHTFNKYTHPTGDGNLHVPATGTSNNGKVLKAGSTAGSLSWGTLSKSDVGLGNVANTTITVTSTSVSDGTNTFSKYTHPTTTAVTAAAVKVGKDSTGHVVIGNALTAADVGASPSGHNHDSDYVNVNGDTMTGNLTMGGASKIIFDHRSQTRASNTIYTCGELKFKNADNSVEYSAPWLRYIGTNATDGYNTALCYGSTNGTTWITAGESGGTLPTVLGAYNDEYIYACADGGMKFYTGCANDGTTYKLALELKTDGYAYGTRVYGAVWNDFAEYRRGENNPGRVMVENGDDSVSMSTKRLQPGASICSDTYGFAIGETEECKCPIAVAGRVLAYPLEPREEYGFFIGQAVCSGPNGTVSIMTKDEVKEYPECVIGYISAVPKYEEWGTGNVKVDGRVWIKVK